VIGLRAELALAVGLFASAAAAQPTAASAPPAPQPPPVSIPHEPARDTAIEVNTLSAPEGPPAGLLDSTNGGLGDDIWSGSARGAIEEMLVRLPLATPIRSVRSLSRRLLLTKSEAPTGPAPRAFQTVRLQALLDAGFVSDTAKLAPLIEVKDAPEFPRVQAEAILLGGTPADACGAATEARETEGERFWMQLRAYCYATAGKSDLLELTRGVMKAEGAADKSFEILLDDVLTHKASSPGVLHDPTAVEVFLLRQLGLPLPAVLPAKFGLAGSVLVLRDVKSSPQARADAATQAMHAGAASTAELGAVADAQVFTPQQFANAETAAAGLPFFQGQALIRQAVARASGDDEKAKLLAVALRLGRQNALLPVAAAMQAKGAAAFSPTTALRPFAPAFAQALLLVREADAAERWRELLDVNNTSDKILAATLAVQLNLVAPNPGRTARAQEALGVLSQNSLSPQPVGGFEAKEIAALALGLTDALGETLTVDMKAQLANLVEHQLPGRRLSTAALKRLAETKDQSGLKGEAILTLLDGIGPGGPGDLSPDTSALIARTLKNWAETDAARAFAIDAFLLYRPQPAPS
jgi:hypothetical protein